MSTQQTAHEPAVELAPPSPPPSVSHGEADQPATAPPAGRPSGNRRKMVLIIAVVLVVALAASVPWILRTLNTVSTDDAYVNGHVTFVAPRVAGQVARVLVEDNNR